MWATIAPRGRPSATSTEKVGFIDRLSEARQTHDKSNEFLVTGNDCSPRIRSPAIYAVGVYRIGATTRKMRDGCLIAVAVVIALIRVRSG
jgi:hypothetical protein